MEIIGQDTEPYTMTRCLEHVDRAKNVLAMNYLQAVPFQLVQTVYFCMHFACYLNASCAYCVHFTCVHFTCVLKEGCGSCGQHVRHLYDNNKNDNVCE